MIHHPDARKAVTAIFEDHICFTADDTDEFLDALAARGFVIAMVVKTEARALPHEQRGEP